MFFVNVGLLLYAFGVEAKATKEAYMVKDHQEQAGLQERNSAQI